MTESNFFVKMANDVLETADHVAARLEESLTLVFGGDKKGSRDAGDPSAANDFTMEDYDQDDGDDGDFENPLKGMADGVLGGILEGQAKASTPLEHFHAFRSAITWSEPFILSLVAFQIVMFCAAIYVSRRDRGLGSRLTMMGTIAVLVKSSEYLNRIAARHWQSFCTQNYFDRRGVFMSVMVCTPLLLDSLIMLLMFLREASQLLIRYKTLQLKEHVRSKKSKDKGGTTNGTAGGAPTAKSDSKKEK